MSYEIDFLPVGDSNGDAICMRHGTPEGYNITVIDGGYTEIGDSIVHHVRDQYDSTHVNNLVLTHADDDHARGLIQIMRSCTVGALFMNRPWLYVDEFIHHHHGNFTRQGLVARLRETHPYLVELEELAAIRGVPIFEAFQGVRYGPVIILAPSRHRYISLLPELDKTPEVYSDTGAIDRFFQKTRDVISQAFEYWDIETLQEKPPLTSASNETSLVQMAIFDNYRAVFTGDVGPDGLREAAIYASRIGLLSPMVRPNLFQIPHQGSRRNVTPSVLNAWLGTPLPSAAATPLGRATCSVGANKTTHPRKRVTNALHRRGYPTQVTRDRAICFSNVGRPGWISAPQVPFYEDVSEDE